MSYGHENAFPLPVHEDGRPVTPAPGYGCGAGLTKRELFAAMAMQGLLSNCGGPIQANGSTGWGLTNVTHDQVAGVACRFADALLARLAE